MPCTSPLAAWSNGMLPMLLATEAMRERRTVYGRCVALGRSRKILSSVCVLDQRRSCGRIDDSDGEKESDRENKESLDRQAPRQRCAVAIRKLFPSRLSTPSLLYSFPLNINNNKSEIDRPPLLELCQRFTNAGLRQA